MKRISLRDARRRQYMTQETLALKSGIDQTTISSLETGRHGNPTRETMERLAAALELPVGKLIFDATERVAS